MSGNTKGKFKGKSKASKRKIQRGKDNADKFLASIAADRPKRPTVLMAGEVPF